jgi:hypothetical protein
MKWLRASSEDVVTGIPMETSLASVAVPASAPSWREQAARARNATASRMKGLRERLIR